MNQKGCGDCGTPLQKNCFGDNDCPKCCSERFFLMTSKKKVEERVKNVEGVIIENIPSEEEVLVVEE